MRSRNEGGKKIRGGTFCYQLTENSKRATGISEIKSNEGKEKRVNEYTDSTK